VVVIVDRLGGGGNSGGGVGRAFGGRWVAVSLWSAILDEFVRVLVLLAGAVDCDLNGNLTSFDLLAVHVRTGLLLQFLGCESNETEAAALAGLVAGLKLADHELWDRAQSDLGRRWLVVGKELKKLLFTKVIRKVCDHDLGLGWDTVLWWTALLAWTKSGALASLLCVNGERALLAWCSRKSLVGGLSQASSLTRNVGGSTVGGGRLVLFASL